MTTASTHDGACNCGKGTDRRTFLQASAIAASGLAFGSPLARAATPVRATVGKKVTVVLFQRGGADALNLFAPTGEPNYAAQRPTLGVSPPGGSGSVIGNYMDPMFSMHPALVGLHAGYTLPGSRVGVVHAVGHRPYDRSHFSSQDEMETGSPDGSLDSGWINRHLLATATAQDAPARAIALTGPLPKSMDGEYPCYAISSTADLVFRGRLPDVRPCLQTISNTPAGGMSAPRQLAYGTAVSTFELIDLFSVLHPTTYVPANGAVYPNTALGTSMRQAAELIKARLGVEFICIDQGGWDHHSALLTRLAANATDYDQSITAFFIDLGQVADDVVLVSMSEFGRELHENGSAGADHGVGGAMVLVGGRVRGGQVHGVWPGLATAQLADQRFLAPQNDFRDVLLELLDRHMGGTAMDAVFPGHSYSPLGIF